MNKNTFTSSDHNQRGFTLVELVLYVALMGVFIVAIATLLTSMYEIRERHSRRTEVEQQGLAIMQTLRYIITESTEIISPLPGASSSTLSVNTESPTDNPTVLQIEDDILTVAKWAIPGVALHNDRVVLSDIAFKNMSLDGTSGSVQIIFTLQYSVKENGLTSYVPGKTFQTSFTLAQ